MWCIIVFLSQSHGGESVAGPGLQTTKGGSDVYEDQSPGKKKAITGELSRFNN